MENVNSLSSQGLATPPSTKSPHQHYDLYWSLLISIRQVKQVLVLQEGLLLKIEPLLIALKMKCIKIIVFIYRPEGSLWQVKYSIHYFSV